MRQLEKTDVQGIRASKRKKDRQREKQREKQNTLIAAHRDHRKNRETQRQKTRIQVLSRKMSETRPYEIEKRCGIH